MITMSDFDLEKSLSRVKASADAIAAEREKFLSVLPVTTPCPRHPEFQQLRDDRESWNCQRPVFKKCELCQAEIRRQQETDRLQLMGVPLNLCSASFDNWIPNNEGAEANLVAVRQFAATRRGFLILLGALGTGKSHLGVAALRTFQSGLFIKQSELLRRLRQTYRDRAAIDPVDEAQNAGCLVLDEMGLSPGGRDELPLLHDVLDHRHGNQKPTVLTGNLKFDELSVVIGDRMADRLRESAFAILYFGGTSHRREAHERYFANE
jgi:DNA replication protein DnaC